MYRKSLETNLPKTSDKNSQSSDTGGVSGEEHSLDPSGKNAEDFRSESIAALRARAQEYTAKNFPKSSETGDETVDSDMLDSDEEQSFNGASRQRSDADDGNKPGDSFSPGMSGKINAKNEHSSQDLTTNSFESRKRCISREGIQCLTESAVRHQTGKIPKDHVRDSKTSSGPTSTPGSYESDKNVQALLENFRSTGNPGRCNFSSRIQQDQKIMSALNAHEGKSLLFPFANGYNFPQAGASPKSTSNSPRQSVLSSGLLSPPFSYLSDMNSAPSGSSCDNTSAKALALPLNFPGPNWGNPFSGLFPGMSQDHLKNHGFMNHYNFGSLEKPSLSMRAYLNPINQSPRLSATEMDIGEKNVSLSTPSSVIAL